MLAKDLISDVVPALRTSDSGMKALYYMDIFRISHLPIVNNKDFLGLISDKDIYDLNMADEPIGNHKLSLISPYVFVHQHIYEVIGVVSNLQLSVIPVLNDNNHYQGCITAYDLLGYFSDLLAVNHPGAILVLELNQRDFSLSQIAQIVEGNDTKILSMYLHTFPDSVKMDVTLKLNRTDLSSVIQTFERYNYTIKASYMDTNDIDGLIENRFESFMRYLNV